MPSTMRHIAYAKGGPETMHIVTGPVPTPGAGDVLVRVMAAGVNRPDVAQRAGAYPPPPGASPLLGLEVAGEVVQSNAPGWAVGEFLCGLANGGGYAEYCVVPGTQCLPWPDGYGAISAAALPENYFTVWANLFQIGRLQPGERVLVHGGTSGIGLTALQLGHEFGSRMLATAGSAGKCDACLRYGASAAINYKEADFAPAVQEFTAGAGVDVVLDMVGGPYMKQNLRSLAMDGRLVLIAFLGGPKVEEMDFTTVMTRRLTITGSTMRPRTAVQKEGIARELLDKVWPVLNAGRCTPVIHEIFPLDHAADAHRLMESSAHIGKIMLQVA